MAGQSLQVLAHQGEALDALLWRVLGSTDAVEAVLENDPTLAGEAELLPQGRPVVIPAAAIAAAQAGAGAADRSAPVVNLWD